MAVRQIFVVGPITFPLQRFDWDIKKSDGCLSVHLHTDVRSFSLRVYINAHYEA